MIARTNLLQRYNAEKYNPALAQQHHVGTELAFTDSHCFFDVPDFAARSQSLFEASLTPTVVHLPFVAIDLGARDERMRHCSLEIVQKALHITARWKVNQAVLHLHLIPQHTQHTQRLILQSFQKSLESLLPLAEASGITLLLENTYESLPDLFLHVITNISSKYLGVCLDLAHIHCFSSSPFSEWWQTLSSHIRHVHFSDNLGNEDSHWSLGRGNIDFPTILPIISEKPELTYTMEMNPQELHANLRYLQERNLLAE